MAVDLVRSPVWLGQCLASSPQSLVCIFRLLEKAGWHEQGSAAPTRGIRGMADWWRGAKASNRTSAVKCDPSASTFSDAILAH